MGNIEQEIARIIERFKSDMERALQKLSSLALSLKRNSAVSQTTESRIQSIVAEYEAAVYRFCLNLKELHIKVNKPHTLALEDLIGNKENELKSFLKDIKQRGLQIFKDIFMQLESVDPLLLTDLNRVIEASFEDLQQKYQQMATDAKNAESNFRRTVIAALTKVVATLEKEE